MTRRPKDIGTEWESMLVRWLTQRLGDTRIERRALHGSKDMGDIYGLYAHGSTGIIEAKAYHQWGPRDLEAWQAQTLAERGNADADWALLVPRRYRVGPKTLGRTPAWLTVEDMLKLSNHSYVVNSFSQHAKDYWLSMDLEHVCRLIEGPLGGDSIG